MDAIYKTTDRKPDETMSVDEALALIAKLGNRVAPDSYTHYERDPETGNDVPRYEVWEVYDEGKTAEDYPDGDPYADAIYMPIE